MFTCPVSTRLGDSPFGNFIDCMSDKFLSNLGPTPNAKLLHQTKKNEKKEGFESQNFGFE